MARRVDKDGTADGGGLTPSARWALASLSLCMLMASLDTSIANVGLPTLARTFGASFQAVQWVVLAYLLAITTLIVSAGRLGDLVGRRRLLLGGIGLFTAASLACGLAPDLPVLIVARAAQGLGAAVMMALAVALVGETVPRARTGSAMGLLGTLSAIGTTLGPSLGGLLIAGPGWRTIFLVNVPIGVVTLLMARRSLPGDRPATGTARGGFDIPGTLLLAATLCAYALAMTSERGPGAARLATVAVLGAGLFLLVQAKSASPLLRLSMFHDARLSAGLAMTLLVSTVMMATLVVGPFYLSRGLGLDAAAVGLALSVGPLMAALAGVPAGRLVDRFGSPAMTAVGLAGMATGLLALSTVPAGLGVIGYVTCIVVVTSHYALFQAANNTAIMTGVGPDRRGVVSGMLALARNLGLITGASAMGAVFAFASGSADVAAALPEAVALGMRTTFTVATLLIVLALVVALAGQVLGRRPAAPGSAS